MLSVEEQPQGQEQRQGKSVQFTRPPRRVYDEPNYGDADIINSVLHKLHEDVLSGYAPAFSSNLLPSKLMNDDVSPVHIQLKDLNKTYNWKLCKPLPFNLLGDAEQLIYSLVKSGVIAECHDVTDYCAGSNFIRKLYGNGVRLVTDLWALNSNLNRLGWPFWASAEFQKSIIGDSKVYWTLDFLMDILKCQWAKSCRI